jgi:hypothetical protein
VRAEVIASGLLQSTSLPLIVATTTIGVQLHLILPANGAALVAAGLLSEVVFPVVALPFLRATARVTPDAAGPVR